MSGITPIPSRASDAQRRRWFSCTLLRLEEGDLLKAFWEGILSTFQAEIDKGCEAWAKKEQNLNAAACREVSALPEVGGLGLPPW